MSHFVPLTVPLTLFFCGQAPKGEGLSQKRGSYIFILHAYKPNAIPGLIQDLCLGFNT